MNDLGKPAEILDRTGIGIGKANPVPLPFPLAILRDLQYMLASLEMREKRIEDNDSSFNSWN
ncbi:conserved hypothetical protein [Ricinus communis]|uniref:Uncharacterized protein n=1 Tax=Ricinus communis TaxID=3988 RepID=B9SBI8_RICCO|nr:conserved hypothetical protein [Ricinus communis]